MKSLHHNILDELYGNSKEVLEKIYVLGIGHSGGFGKILSMQLNHVGLRAYTVFDEINPPFKKGNLYIAISQSGETKTIVA